MPTLACWRGASGGLDLHQQTSVTISFSSNVVGHYLVCGIMLKVPERDVQLIVLVRELASLGEGESLIPLILNLKYRAVHRNEHKWKTRIRYICEVLCAGSVSPGGYPYEQVNLETH